MLRKVKRQEGYNILCSCCFSKSFVLARFRPSKDYQIKKTTETILDPLRIWGVIGSGRTRLSLKNVRPSEIQQ